MTEVAVLRGSLVFTLLPLHGRIVFMAQRKQ